MRRRAGERERSRRRRGHAHRGGARGERARRGRADTRSGLIGDGRLRHHLEHLGELHRDVVGATPIVGELHQHGGGVLEAARRERLAHAAEDVGVERDVGEAIARGEEHVARKNLHGLGARFDVDVGLHPERAGDLVEIGVPDGLLFGEHARVDHALHHRVVAGQRVNLVAADHVGAAVSDVRHLDPGVVQQHRHDRRPRSHAVLGRAAQGVDATPRLFDRGLERLRGRVVRGHTVDDLEDRRDRRAAGLAPAVVPAHAVAEHEQVPEAALGVARRVLVHLLVGVAARVARLHDLEADT
jgi:hypothetical protein